MASTSCSGHGQCLTLEQAATLVLENEEPTAYTYGLDPNNDHTWDHDKIQICHCDAGYSGYDCSREDCPKGDNPDTYSDVDEIQLLQCTASSGSFTLTFRQQTTLAIAVGASAADVKSALGALSSVSSSVQVSLSSGSVVCTASSPPVISVTFTGTPGALPPLTSDTSQLGGGSGSVTVTTSGSSLGGVTSVTGTKENAVCSNHGTCDTSTGICTCDSQWYSSNGQGEQGIERDCGYHSLTSAAAANDA